jgi:hypothetical protein
MVSARPGALSKGSLNKKTLAKLNGTNNSNGADPHQAA